MRQKKLAYLRQLLLYTQLEKVAPVALWSEEAKHSIRLSGDCNILGLETAHCKAPEVIIYALHYIVLFRLALAGVSGGQSQRAEGAGEALQRCGAVVWTRLGYFGATYI